MDSSNEMDVVEVSKKLLGELEDMGFPLARAARALHHSGNSGIEAAVNWIIDHENDPNIDQMPVIAVNIDIECPPQQIHTMEEMEAKALDLRDKARKKREEEEKKLERAREKERIHAGKEISQAKRIAEDSERRRYLAQKKAEREEEKRARQRIKLKLDEDKAERRRMLGLPPVMDTTIQNARPSSQEKKQMYVKSVEKAEQLRECLRSIKQNHQDDEATVKKAFETLLIYVGNVARNPDVEMYRKIRISNPAFQSRVGRLIGGIEFLGLCGFEIIEEGKLLYLPGDKVDMAVLNSAGSELKSAITNPFFGLISRPYSRI
ncbi:UBX domain-containing protein 1 [Linum perenne]